MVFLIDHIWIWVVVAVPFSLLWGFYGIAEEEKKKKEEEEENKGKEKKSKEEKGFFYWVVILGVFFSEFLGSLIGWTCLYFLVCRALKSVDLGVFDVFLGTVAIVGITGFFHQIVKKLD